MTPLVVLATAVVTASVMGSLHCVGMCGPLAIWASGSGDKVGKKTMAASTTLYHLGRLVTYAIAGAVAGLIGSLIDSGGGMVGIQVAAARFVGTAMVLIGLYKLVSLWWPASTSKVATPSAVGKVLVKLRPYIFGLPVLWRAFATGLLTTLLPCGWLYLFALIAAGTGSPIGGAVVMSAFWLGSVPALTALVAGVRLLSQRFVKLVPAVAAVFLITAGLFTASGRGFAGFERFDELASEGSLLEQVDQTDEKLPPCCRVNP
ncbi:sulfite exporter TauE/SafE family protein [Roseiconus lacunae]|uniref:Sulfite exporter TauE/SafE family protein n=1 Tax=Roseiconus lacunae TaxID=2605694 RepID=A0ABT7PCI2_9BACT|nr:sulfite exporter TauE/SafE family protein [Roseiconus lacunae]MDM4013966.1 sulfite exporter TauE/SafE family protein [Roseiconus lacunae]WRQ53262.1 sulfite exporter TauE/SafE family protein [Stieleria sp. HD01]